MPSLYFLFFSKKYKAIFTGHKSLQAISLCYTVRTIFPVSLPKLLVLSFFPSTLTPLSSLLISFLLEMGFFLFLLYNSTFM